ncbi:hypothetical protein CP083_03165 [Candidatus Bathyarchaeota archaeon B24-2]|nr:MAG: hypothetical protein CP083_03165 [Candidatus Bathyarchaeota archaeon B24-2]
MKDSTFGFLLTIPGLVFLTLVVAFPLSLLFSLSFLRYDFIHPITFHGLRNYVEVLNNRVFWLSLRNTIIYSGGTTTLTLLIGLLLAVSAARIKRFSALFRTLLILPWAVPLVVSGLVWRWMLDPGVGVYNYILTQVGFSREPINIFGEPTLAMIGCILSDSWTRIPFMFIVILAGIKSIPPDLYEAARVDGANRIATFRNITLPLVKKSMLTGTLITSMFSFRTIDNIWSMTRGGPAKATYVIGLNLIDYLVRYQNLGFGAAIGVIMLGLISIFATLIVYYILKE